MIIKHNQRDPSTGGETNHGSKCEIGDDLEPSSIPMWFKTSLPCIFYFNLS